MYVLGMYIVYVRIMYVVSNKNDDSVKEAPAFCQSFLDSLYK